MPLLRHVVVHIYDYLQAFSALDNCNSPYLTNGLLNGHPHSSKDSTAGIIFIDKGIQEEEGGKRLIRYDVACNSPSCHFEWLVI